MFNEFFSQRFHMRQSLVHLAGRQIENRCIPGDPLVKLRTI